MLLIIGKGIKSGVCHEYIQRIIINKQKIMKKIKNFRVLSIEK